MTDHPLTETAAVEMWDASPCPEGYEFRGMLTVEQDATLYAMRAAFDAGREHERTTPAAAEPLARTLLGVPAGHGAPHHDVKEIKAEDYVLQVDRDGFIRAGKAHCQAADGDWHDENGGIVTWAARRADRPDALTVWPAPTPPAEGVDLPSEHPAHITDVETDDGHGCAYMALDHSGDWCGVSTTGLFLDRRPHDLAAFTLSDGTRARRDGEHEDGKPRFVKADQ